MGNDLIQDIRYALRSLRHNAGFFVTAVLIIGLGVGGSTAIFSVVNPMLLRSLPFDQPDRLVWIANSGTGGLSSVTSRTSNLTDYRRMNRSFEQMSGYFAFFDYMGFNLTGDGEPERLVGVPVAQDFLDILGVQPALGRSFPDEQSFWQGNPTILLTNGFWQRRYAGDPEVVGSIVTINDQPVEVLGVLPESFDFATYFTPGSRIDFLTVFPINEQTDQQGNTLVIVGRMKPGVTVADAQAELDLMNEQLQAADPERWGLGAVAYDLQERITGRFRGAMFLLAGAAALVMVIVCANLSNLLLARATNRRKEIAVRRAMGAGRGRLVRQMLTESIVLAVAGAVLGVLVAFTITRSVASATAINVPLLHSVTVDGTALAFSAALAVLAGLLFGLAPALQSSVGSAQAALTDASRGSSAGRGAAWLRESLVVSEVALACVLLIGGGLLLRSFFAVLDVDLGFDESNAMTWRVDTSRNFDSGEQKITYFQRIVASVAEVPGVEQIGFSDTLPLGRNRGWGVRVLGVEYTDENCCPGALPRLVDPGYLQAMRIPLISGRYFTPSDTVDTELVIIINRTAARALFPEEPDPINRVLIVNGQEFRIAGIVADVRHSSLEEQASNEMYILATQEPNWWGAVELVVRSPLPPESLAGGVRAAIRSVDADLPASDFQTLEDIVDRAVSPRRFILLIIQGFAVTALLLASLGIYGVLSYSVSQRTQEMGIRMALGASGRQLQAQVVARTLAMASIGVVIGWLGALALSRVMGSLLYGVGTTDPLTYAGVTVLLIAIAALAGYVPARRAAHVDPMRVLTA
ncbi:MAG: ABC transporter permease [Acidobacteriota bacterium]|jgi:predicted permease